MSQALTKDATPEGVIFPIPASILKSLADHTTRKRSLVSKRFLCGFNADGK
jgi:hypothetical protein